MRDIYVNSRTYAYVVHMNVKLAVWSLNEDVFAYAVFMSVGQT